MANAWRGEKAKAAKPADFMLPAGEPAQAQKPQTDKQQQAICRRLSRALEARKAQEKQGK